MEREKRREREESEPESERKAKKENKGRSETSVPAYMEVRNVVKGFLRPYGGPGGRYDGETVNRDK